MRDLVVIGGGGHAKVIIDIAKKCGYNIKGFLDDNEKVSEVMGYRRLGAICDCLKFSNSTEFFIAIGDNRKRKSIHDSYKLNYAILIHPNAVVAENVVIGKGTAVMAGAVINPDAKIGKQVIVNTASVVEHDTVIGNFSMLAPHSTVCGFSKLGDYCWLGAGATVNNVIDICDSVLIGSGGVVVENITESGVYVWVPVKKIKR